MVKKSEKKIKGGKNIVNAEKLLDSDREYNVGEAVELLKKMKYTKFNESIDVAVQLGVDPRHSDQMVRGMVSMPNGIGKEVKVAVFAKDAKFEDAKAAGADFVGGDDLVDMIKNGQDFDIYIATPDMMGVVGKVARDLGPKGKMPNPKLGTVTMDIKQAIESAKKGQVKFKVEKAGIVHAAIGKVDFATDKLVENIKEFLSALMKAKPAGVKGSYMKSMFISSTMSRSIKINLAELVS